MFTFLLLFVQVAYSAGGWWLESASSPDREVAAAVEAAARKDGFAVRVVKRFRLGEGWTHVALVEGFADETSAGVAAARLRKETGVAFTLVTESGGGKLGRTPAEPEAPKKNAAPSAASTVARCLEAHGGGAAGVAALARSPGVHFRFLREFSLDGKQVKVHHEYWRDATSRRLVVTGGGMVTDSVLVVTSAGGWVAAGGKVEERDIGVLVSQADAFAPEVVLGAALDVPSLFEGAEPGTLMLLEGAESGVRVGRGEDPQGSGFAFADVHATTGLLQRVRYVTDAGPVVYTYGEWSAPHVALPVPGVVAVEHADGTTEAIRVEALELLDSLPAGTFSPPEIGSSAP